MLCNNIFQESGKRLLPHDMVPETESSSFNSWKEGPLPCFCFSAVFSSMRISNWFFKESPLSRNSFSFVLKNWFTLLSWWSKHAKNSTAASVSANCSSSSVSYKSSLLSDGASFRCTWNWEFTHIQCQCNQIAKPKTEYFFFYLLGTEMEVASTWMTPCSLCLCSRNAYFLKDEMIVLEKEFLDCLALVSRLVRIWIFLRSFFSLQ